jgi:dolichol-phosphate mannosyltransferase
MSDVAKPAFSFVLPAYNEAPNVETMTQRLCVVGEGLGESFEILWVKDGSSDGTADALDALARDDSRVRVLHLSRNFGHMAALTAGLEGAGGTDAVVCLDADGQHPPELIPDLVDHWRKGADIVQTVKERITGESAVENWTKKVFIGMMRWLSEIELPPGAADFRLLDREVVDCINGLPESIRFVRGLVCWTGFSLLSSAR